MLISLDIKRARCGSIHHQKFKTWKYESKFWYYWQSVLFRNANFLPQRKSKMLSILKMSRINPLLGQEILAACTHFHQTDSAGSCVKYAVRCSSSSALYWHWHSPGSPGDSGRDASVDNCLLICLSSSGYPAINLAEMALQPEHRQYFKERPGNLTVVEGESVTLRWAATLLLSAEKSY